MAFAIKEYLLSRQALVDLKLTEILARQTQAPAILLDAMRYSLLAPGKRLRPSLVFMAAQTAGGTDEQALAAACAVEMIHTYSLIHDDLPAMDDDDLRRGRPTCHIQFGEALAILAGDGLLTLAFQVLAESYLPQTATGCCLALAQGSGCAGMVGGQVEDLAWEHTAKDDERLKDELFPRNMQPHSLQALEHIHQHKTGALFQACLRLGLWAIQGEHPGGPNLGLRQRLETYGQCFGLVFQITDDLIDVEGSASSTGKRVQKDAARGKLTYPGLLGVPQSRNRANQLAKEAHAALHGLGSAAEPLAALMEYILTRDR